MKNIKEKELYHYDIPLTIQHEEGALQAAGFSEEKILNNWGQTYTIKAVK